jgi:hypothetical protein
MRKNRIGKLEEIDYYEGPDDGEDDFDEELEIFLYETRKKMDIALTQDRRDLKAIVENLRQKLLDENYLFNAEFIKTGVLKLLLEILSQDLVDENQFVSDIFEILGMVCVSSLLRDKITGYNQHYFEETIQKYLTNLHESYAKNLFFFLSNYVSEPETRDVFTTQISYFSFIKPYNKVPNLVKDNKMALEYLRFLSNLLST